MIASVIYPLMHVIIVSILVVLFVGAAALRDRAIRDLGVETRGRRRYAIQQAHPSFTTTKVNKRADKEVRLQRRASSIGYAITGVLCIGAYVVSILLMNAGVNILVSCLIWVLLIGALLGSYLKLSGKRRESKEAHKANFEHSGAIGLVSTPPKHSKGPVHARS